MQNPKEKRSVSGAQPRRRWKAGQLAAFPTMKKVLAVL